MGVQGISAMRVKAGLRGMPRAGLNGWRLRRQTGGMLDPFQRVAH